MIELGFEFQAMASACELRLVGDDESALRRAAQAAIAEVHRIERKYSRYDAGSLVSRINASAGRGQAVPVDDETAGLLAFAGRLHALSGGRFDITSGVLRRAWDFRAGRVPGGAEVKALLPLIGWPRVVFDGHRVALPQAGMEIDFGGFGKEYAADRAAALLRQAGVAGGYVNLGGDIAVLGPRSDGRGWRLGIRHPRRDDAMIDTLELGAGALATSGDYERYWQSVSVVAPTCAAAGAACTITMLLGARGLTFIREQSLPFLAVDVRGVVIRV